MPVTEMSTIPMQSASSSKSPQLRLRGDASIPGILPARAPDCSSARRNGPVVVRDTNPEVGGV